MRKSILQLLIVGGLASWAAPGLAQGSPQQQRYVTAAEEFFGNPPSAAARSGCGAGSAKDVVASKSWRNRCE
jgi:hypothetical protein